MRLFTVSALFPILSLLANAAPTDDFDKRQAFNVGQAVGTTSGTVVGHAATNRNQVSEYLGIPFARPPVGELRFAEPEPFLGSGTINAERYSPDCPANLLPVTDDSVLPLAGPNSFKLLEDLAQVGNAQSEDCLTLNIWTKPQTGERAKAVLFWIYGGGFSIGATNNPTYDGEFLADDEDVIVVSANYRLNVFGFPGLPGLGLPQNPGLLDQRLAIEWVRDNIAAFGGDPNRITIFGQSAGGLSVDIYSYAWVSDPIVAGFIPHSGAASNPSAAALLPANNSAAFLTVSEAVGCSATSLAAAIPCVRTKPFQALLDASRSDNPLAAVTGSFSPTVDGRVVFADIAERIASGNFIRRPMLVGNTNYETGLFKVVAAAGNQTFPDIIWEFINLIAFTCGAKGAADARAAQGVPVWRYRYFGEFPNTRLTLNPSSGAWHGGELPLVFGSTEFATGVANTPAEASLQTYLKGAWAAFAKDPAGALGRAPYRWPRYNRLTRTLVQFGCNNATQPRYGLPISFDLSCSLIDGLVGSLPPVTGGGIPDLGGIDIGELAGALEGISIRGPLSGCS
ncbi:alpha/beta-hydrolase [Aulographum hederae CBS 113979]|uniref:Carboxylic ester hydrolase n=1 Tax=Aulographum hederae CBS 113979 TaxID=1176131 RepID=A0A6G1HDV8_9PEZI|nr:alpha/beta-hydrolase [Aulographum hederae CBS 113979]